MRVLDLLWVARADGFVEFLGDCEELLMLGVDAGDVDAVLVFPFEHNVRMVCRPEDFRVKFSGRGDTGSAEAPLHLAFDGVIERNVVLVENGAGGALKRGARFYVGALRGDFGGLALRQQALILNHKE